MQDYVALYMGQRFMEPQSSDLSAVFKKSFPVTSLIFVLSAGTNRAAELHKLAEKIRFSKKFSSISLGQRTTVEARREKFIESYACR